MILPQPADVLVAYATKMGGTRDIAATIARELTAHGLRVDLAPAAEVGDVAGYRLVVLGSAVYLRRWRPDAVRFLRRHADGLRDVEVRLFQSGPCGPDAAPADRSRPDRSRPEQPEPGRVRRLRARIGAGAPVTFGGRLDPATAQGILARWMAKGALAGDFRDTDQIRRWAAGIAAELDPGRAGLIVRAGAEAPSASPCLHRS